MIIIEDYMRHGKRREICTMTYKGMETKNANKCTNPYVKTMKQFSKTTIINSFAKWILKKQFII